METKFKIDLLCFFNKVKGDKTFYRLYKRDINLYIRVLRDSIDIESKDKKNKTKKRFKLFTSYIPGIFNLVTAYFGSKYTNST